MRQTINQLLDAASAEDLPRAILDQLPVGITIVRASDGGRVYHNAETERLIGGSPKSVGGFDDYATIGAYGRSGRPLPPDEYPIARAARHGERIDGEVLQMRRHDGAWMNVKVSARPVRDADGRIVYGLAIFEDVTRLHALERQRDVSEARLAEVLEATTDGVFAVAGDWTVTFMNGRARAMLTAGRDIVGQTLWEVFPEGRETTFFQAYERAMQTRAPQRAEDDYPPLKARFEAFARPNPDGGLSIFFRDVTEERAVQAARETLTRELDHRVRNLFLLVSGMARMGARRHDDVDAFAAELDGRIRALAAAHDLIQPALGGAADGPKAGLRSLLEIVLKPHADAGAAIAIEGDTVPLGPQAGADLALVLHELATNAAKYGGLSGPGGRLEIGLSCDAERCVIDWREYNPHGAPPAARKPEGFGSQLIDAITRSKLGGAIRSEPGPEGFVYRIEAPLARLSA